MKSLIRKLKYKILSILVPSGNYIREVSFCSVCGKNTPSVSLNGSPRDNLKCVKCKASPREKKLYQVLNEHYPNWKTLSIHESSPSRRGTSELLSQSQNYIGTHFYPNRELGEYVRQFRNENLENQTFEDSMFDLVVTQDVMEHVYFPDKAFQEIARTLKLGGAHIFTIPVINLDKKSEVWATLGVDGKPNFLKEPEYHGNPIDSSGSPVTMHWGYDIIDYIKECSGLETQLIKFKEEMNGTSFDVDVFVSRKIL